MTATNMQSFAHQSMSVMRGISEKLFVPKTLFSRCDSLGMVICVPYRGSVKYSRPRDLDTGG
jgi:hypothetical protein